MGSLRRKRGESRLFPELNSKRVNTAVPVPKKGAESGSARNSERMLQAPSETWENTVRLWVDSCLETDAKAFATTRDLFDNFVRWIAGSGEKGGSKRSLARMLLTMGFGSGVRIVNNKTTRGVVGIKIRGAALREMVPIHKETDPILAWVQDWDMAYIGKEPGGPDTGVTDKSLIVYVYYPGVYIVHVGFEFYSTGWIKVTRIFGRDGTVVRRLYPKKIADAFYAQLLAAGFKEQRVKGIYRKRYDDILAWRVLEGRKRMGMLSWRGRKEVAKEHAEVKKCLMIVQ